MKIQKELEENPLLKNLGVTIYGSVHEAKHSKSELHKKVGSCACETEASEAMAFIGASLSEPHTSVYSGTILLCVRTSVRLLHMHLCSKYPTSSRAYSSLLALALDFDRANLDG